MNSKVFYKLNAKMQELEEKLEILENKIKETRAEMKKLKKSSSERNEMQIKIESMSNSKEYIELKSSIKMLNFCINVACYY